ncbi:substrate-binding periplasmic protein [Chitinolyticbacter meiyuanensis]|uniref:substrate-binding periplasmic protein n=1 Tax=Chitinolyticbacter meiyuanensis TaxID=682798 RepID=UPI0011E59A52|nr:transporter substrate-binding domain-containing protein [Chitinolyticbacter meiyuanensis]
MVDGLTRWIACGALLLTSVLASAETITINAEDDWKPFSWRGARNQAQGYATELVRAAFASQGITVHYNVVPFARCLREVEQGASVACFNIEITGYNRDRFLWPRTPLIEEDLAIYARADSRGQNLGSSDLVGKTVALTNGYTYPSVIMNDAGILKDNSPSDEAQLRKLLSGRVDYALLNATPAQLLIRQEPAFRGKIKRVGQVNRARFFLGFSLKHPEAERLRTRFDAGMAALKASGDLQRMEQAFKARHQLQ